MDEVEMDIIMAARDGGFINKFAHMSPDQAKAPKVEKAMLHQIHTRSTPDPTQIHNRSTPDPRNSHTRSTPDSH
jgi:hypothetical protein